MKYISAILFFQLFLFNAFSQGWNCFPPNQKSYYQFSVYQSDEVDLIVQDSTRQDSLGTTLFFRRHELNPGAESCRNELLLFYGFNYYPNQAFIDSAKVLGDTSFYYSVHDTVFFLANAQVGQSWTQTTFGTFTITCDSIISDTLYGQSDSVKYFHSSGAVQVPHISLSKNFGFLNFVPFLYFAWNTPPVLYQLVGLQNSGFQTGFQPPHFLDYLPYHVGDILKWDYFFDGRFWFPSYHFFYSDSITQVDVYADSLVYYYDRIKLDTGNNVFYIPGQTMKFDRLNFGNLLESPPNDFGLSDRNPFGQNDPGIYVASAYQIQQDTVLLNSMIERTFNWHSSFIYHDTACVIIEAVDGIQDAYAFNTHQGLVREDYYGQTTDTHYTLVGARINGITYGDPYIHVGIEEQLASTLRIYPNPFDDYLNIEDKYNVWTQLEITDLFGRIIISQSLDGEKQLLNLEGLPVGCYILSLKGDKKTSRLIIKQ